MALSDPDVVDDLEAEQDRLEAVLAGLSPAQWTASSAAAGWSIADVVLHLAQTEEAVAATLSGEAEPANWRRFAGSVDDAMARMVAAERDSPPTIFDRWRLARRASVAGLRAADPARPVRWAVGTVKPRTLATTRLAEHWAHALDIVTPLNLDYPDTARLRHIAWLGFTTLPYAFRLAGQHYTPITCDLTAPDGTHWHFGTPPTGGPAVDRADRDPAAGRSDHDSALGGADRGSAVDRADRDPAAGRSDHDSAPGGPDRRPAADRAHRDSAVGRPDRDPAADHAAGGTISGSAGAFCRVGARRLAPAESGLRTSGPRAALALSLLRNYADV